MHFSWILIETYDKCISKLSICSSVILLKLIIVFDFVFYIQFILYACVVCLRFYSVNLVSD